MNDSQYCKECRKETLFIPDTLISVGPHYGERMTLSHCHECGHNEILNSILVPKE